MYYIYNIYPYIQHTFQNSKRKWYNGTMVRHIRDVLKLILDTIKPAGGARSNGRDTTQRGSLRP